MELFVITFRLNTEAESGCERILAAHRSYGYASHLGRRSRSLSATLGSSMGFSDSL